MTREHVLMVLGALVLISPWSGIPMEWLQWILLLIGLAVIGLAFMIRSRTVSTPSLPPSQSQTEEPHSRSAHIAFS